MILNLTKAEARILYELLGKKYNASRIPWALWQKVERAAQNGGGRPEAAASAGVCERSVTPDLAVVREEE